MIENFAEWREHIAQQKAHGNPFIGHKPECTDVLAMMTKIEQLRAALEPFMRYYDGIRFNLRKQPRPTDAAIEEHGERIVCVTWAEFYALRDALSVDGEASGCRTGHSDDAS